MSAFDCDQLDDSLIVQKQQQIQLEMKRCNDRVKEAIGQSGDNKVKLHLRAMGNICEKHHKQVEDLLLSSTESLDVRRKQCRDLIVKIRDDFLSIAKDIAALNG